MIEFSPIPKTLVSIIPNEYTGLVSEQLLVCDVHTDSREVAPGGLFIALSGLHGSGEVYISNAVENGAVAILVENEHVSSIINVEVPVIGIENLKSHVPQIADKFFGSASRSLSVIGVTGTNGKSTIASLVAQLGELYGLKSGIIGTLGYGLIKNCVVETGMTTPDSVKCHRILAELSEANAKLVAMEVSSHGIDQNRIGSIFFEVGIISNITRDHLDYHGTFEVYANTKKAFLLSKECNSAVVNFDDPECVSLTASLKSQGKDFITYSVCSSSADVSGSIKKYLENSMEIVIDSPWGKIEATYPLVGEFNLSNLLAALSALCFKGYSFSDFVKLIPSLRSVPGRLEIIEFDSDVNLPQVFVDFAHTADALAQVLNALKKHVKGKLWVVFGCGGDRDKGKRPEMGKVAAQLADRIIVTSDNPRSEAPSAIIADIVAGIDNNVAFETVEDRRIAIFLALGSCTPEDTVLVAGKGHENYQVVGDKKSPFQDCVVVKEALKHRCDSIGGVR